MEKDKVFESHPNLKVYYKTSDGAAFYNENLAQLHAKTLSDKTVEPIYKSVLEKVVTALENIKQDKIQSAVASDLLSGTQTDAEKQAQKEAEDQAIKDAQALAEKEAEDQAIKDAQALEEKEAKANATQEVSAKAKKVTQPKQK